MNMTNVGTPNINENRKDRLHLKGEKKYWIKYPSRSKFKATILVKSLRTLGSFANIWSSCLSPLPHPSHDVIVHCAFKIPALLLAYFFGVIYPVLFLIISVQWCSKTQWFNCLYNVSRTCRFCIKHKSATTGCQGNRCLQYSWSLADVRFYQMHTGWTSHACDLKKMQTKNYYFFLHLMLTDKNVVYSKSVAGLFLCWFFDVFLKFCFVFLSFFCNAVNVNPSFHSCVWPYKQKVSNSTSLWSHLRYCTFIRWLLLLSAQKDKGRKTHN